MEDTMQDSNADDSSPEPSDTPREVLSPIVCSHCAHAQTEDATKSFFLHPRTLTILALMLLALVYVAMTPEIDDTTTNVKFGIFAAIMVFILIGTLQFPDGPFIRPHPAIWRAVLSISVLYQMTLVFLLYMNKNDARKLFSYIDPTLGVELPERSYAENCKITVHNVLAQSDIFVLAHALGWFGKALILRDVWFCWILSIMFEVCEYSLQHQLPNFKECWWDHWILDVLVCNWLGIYLGMKTCEYFEMKQYSWRGFREIPTIRGKVSRTVQQFTPHSWTRFEWGTTKSFKNYVVVVFLLAIFLQCELNCFYLKYLLWIPPEHPLNTWRLFFYFLAGVPGTRELYQYVTDKNCKRIGPQAWLVMATICTETLICVKLGQGEFPNPTPTSVKWFWAVLLTLVVGYGLRVLSFTSSAKRKEKKLA
ncbi:uncharacterized protein VTP21DRAFT_330 [Calcarisporiella thermophila]|uniref:uncharacterized protein n=1 Tax=Calcarisporiella thermophila TaxID=911321 RepID=UPI0037444434